MWKLCLFPQSWAYNSCPVYADNGLSNRRFIHKMPGSAGTGSPLSVDYAYLKFIFPGTQCVQKHLLAFRGNRHRETHFGRPRFRALLPYSPYRNEPTSTWESQIQDSIWVSALAIKRNCFSQTPCTPEGLHMPAGEEFESIKIWGC